VNSKHRGRLQNSSCC